MTIHPISKVLEMADGQLIEGLKGIVKAIYAQSSGESSYGPWTIQNVTLSEGKDEIKLKLMNRGELPQTFKGKQIHLVAHQSTKGISGLKVELETYKGKTSKVVKVTESAEIVQTERAGSEVQSQLQEPPAQQAQLSAQTETVRPPSLAKKFCPECGLNTDNGNCRNTQCSSYVPLPPTEMDNGKAVSGAVIEANKTLGRNAALMVMASLKTLQVVEEFTKLAGLPWTETDKADTARLIGRQLCQTTFTTFFISGQKQGLDMELPPRLSDLSKMIEEIRQKQQAKA